MTENHSFNIKGIIEGFYGRPWTFNQRKTLLKSMKRLKLNTYFYAPKFDLNHRLKWRESYPGNTISQFKELINEAFLNDVLFVACLSPGLDINLNNKNDFNCLKQKCETFLEIGCSALGILLDDIPYAKADPLLQARLLNNLKNELPSEIKFFTCPTIYCDLQRHKEKNADRYLEVFGQNLDSLINVFWTGPTVISSQIEPENLTKINKSFNRKVIIWDNYVADDYVPASTVFMGPYENRSENLSIESEGVVLNPSQHFYLSQSVIYTFAGYANNPQNYNPSREWSAFFDRGYPEIAEILKIIAGYFYSIHGPSNWWSKTITQIKSALNDSSQKQEISVKLRSLLHCISNENLIQHDIDLYQDLFPYIVTLKGDLDFALKILDREHQNESKGDLIMRDIRWTSPIYREILNHYKDRL